MLLPASNVPSPASAAKITPSPAKRISIIHFNDVYNVEARDIEPVGGAAKFVQKCKQLVKVLLTPK
jgi:hypothetical protein